VHRDAPFFMTEILRHCHISATLKADDEYNKADPHKTGGNKNKSNTIRKTIKEYP
jgi:hypothetical protein